MELQWHEEQARLAGTELTLVRGGRGQPLLVLHEELGYPGWMRWNAELAGEYELIIPIQPGFAGSPRLDWIRSFHDLAGFYARLLRELKLPPVDVIGFSTGGWLAAEMAAQDARQFRRMVLVAPAGIRPPNGEIADLFLVTARSFLRSSVLDSAATPEFDHLYGGERTPEQLEAFEDARAEIARLAYEPYLFNPSLPHLLEGVAGLPAMILWGREDRIVPLSAAEAYRQALAGAELQVLNGCGHRPEIERREQFLELVRGFLRR